MTHGGAYVAGEMYYGFWLIELYSWSQSGHGRDNENDTIEASTTSDTLLHQRYCTMMHGSKYHYRAEVRLHHFVSNYK